MVGASPHPIHPFNSELGHHSATGYMHEPLSNLGGIYSHLHNQHFPPPQHQPPSQRPTTLNEFISWNQSPQGLYPSTLIGPGLNPDLLPCPQPQPPSNTRVASTDNSRKRKRNTSPGETSSIGGFGPPSPGDNAADARPPSPSPPPLTSKARRNAASDVWAFARPLTSDDAPPNDEWPTSSEPHSINKLKTPWIGCKLCTEFGCVIHLPAYYGCILILLCHRDKFGLKQWTVFQNKKESSPTTTFRRHLEGHHTSIWRQECLRLNIPVEDRAKKSSPEPTLSAPGTEPYTKENLMKYIVNFVTSDDQVC